MNAMKTTKQKALWVIALLTGITAIISCEEETDLKARNEQSVTSIHEPKTGTAFLSTGSLKEKLIQRASEAYATLYDVALTPENTRVIDEEVLHGWIKANEINKHESINQKNREALAAIAEQGNIYALLVTAPDGAKFTESVFIFGRLTSVMISDAVDIVTGPRLICVKVGVGFYGNGVLDPWGEISCGCVEEYKIIPSTQPYSKCGRCPDPDDL